MDKVKNTDLVKIDSSILKKVNDQLEITNRLIAQSSERIEECSFLRPLIIDATRTTPSIYCDAKLAIIEIKGRMIINGVSDISIPFFKPLEEWLRKYVERPIKPTRVNVKIMCLNTCGSLCMLMIFKLLESLHKSNNQLLIYWYYEEEDGDMLETGEDFESIIRVPFKMIPYKGGGDI